MAMYCFCHCFLYPRTECIMWYGVVRKFYLKTKWNQKGMKFRKSSLFDLYFRYLQLFLWEKLFSLTWRRLPSITLHITSFLLSVTLLTIVLNQWVSKNFCSYWGKKRKWKCVTYLWSSISYQLSKGQSKCVDLHWMEILLHCFYLRILTDLIFPFTFRMQARQTSEGHIVNCLFSCTLIRTKNLTLRLNSGRWIKDRNLLFRSKVT